jgi:hypothetical protein
MWVLGHRWVAAVHVMNIHRVREVPGVRCDRWMHTARAMCA